MGNKVLYTFLIFAFLLVLSGCANETLRNSAETATTSSVPTSIDNVTDDTGAGNGSYMAHMNFVERKASENGASEYVPILDGIVYNGGTLDLYAEFLFSGDRKNVKSMDAAALLFIDGYIQEFSLENSEPALIQNLTVPNKETARIHLSCIPTTYDENSDKHTIIAVILPKWQAGLGNFVRDTAVMAVGREIALNKINVPEENRIVKMGTREKTGWDVSHTELPFEQDGSKTNIIFHCFDQGETNCYILCDGKLFSQDEKFIFAADNQASDTSYFGVSLNDSDVGKPLYVLYIPKNYDGSAIVERTCNYVWE